MRYTVTCFFTLLLLFFINSCQSDYSFDIPDISKIEIDYNPIRTEALFFGKDNANTRQHIEAFTGKDPEIADLYFNKLMQLGSMENNEYLPSATLFFQNEAIQSLRDSVELILKDVNTQLEILKDGFKYFKHYFPNKNTPQVFTAITEFGPAAFTLDTAFAGISLDMYLGPQFVYYPSVGFHQYQITNFKPEFIPANTLKAVYQSHFPFDAKETNMLDQMVYNGKLLYLLDLTLPDTEDYIKIGYTEEHIEWCKNNEGRIWAFFIEGEMLYETQSKIFMKYLTDGPTSSGMPQESPGNIASWVGWQMVRTFMKNNPKFTVEQLMEIKIGQQILARSKYKPKEGLF